MIGGIDYVRLCLRYRGRHTFSPVPGNSMGKKPKKRQFLRRRVVIYKDNLHKLSTEPAFRCSSLKQYWEFFLEKMFNYKIVRYSPLQESYVIQHKKVAEIFGAEQENVLTLQPQKRKRGTLRGIFLPSSLRELKKQVQYSKIREKEVNSVR